MCSGTPAAPGSVPPLATKYAVYPVPRPAKQFAFKPGDTTVLRQRMGKRNNVVLESIAEEVGREILTVEKIEGDLALVVNDLGQYDVIPTIFLIPPGVSDEDSDNV